MKSFGVAHCCVIAMLTKTNANRPQLESHVCGEKSVFHKELPWKTCLDSQFHEANKWGKEGDVVIAEAAISRDAEPPCCTLEVYYYPVGDQVETYPIDRKVREAIFSRRVGPFLDLIDGMTTALEQDDWLTLIGFAQCIAECASMRALYSYYMHSEAVFSKSLTTNEHILEWLREAGHGD